MIRIRRRAKVGVSSFLSADGMLSNAPISSLAVTMPDDDMYSMRIIIRVSLLALHFWDEIYALLMIYQAYFRVCLLDIFLTDITLFSMRRASHQLHDGPEYFIYI